MVVVLFDECFGCMKFGDELTDIIPARGIKGVVNWLNVSNVGEMVRGQAKA